MLFIQQSALEHIMLTIHLSGDCNGFDVAIVKMTITFPTCKSGQLLKRVAAMCKPEKGKAGNTNRIQSLISIFLLAGEKIYFGFYPACADFEAGEPHFYLQVATSAKAKVTSGSNKR